MVAQDMTSHLKILEILFILRLVMTVYEWSLCARSDGQTMVAKAHAMTHAGNFYLFIEVEPTLDRWKSVAIDGIYYL